jgi:aminoglycoside phosphotransferase (APT) family kinase protein
MKQFGDRMPAEFRALAALYLDHTEAVCDLLDKGPETLTHGDSHIGNTFTDHGEVGLLDWACVCRAPGIRDVSYYLCNSVPTSVRRECESTLLRRYLEKLGQCGGVSAPFEDAWRQYRRLATHSWIAATVTAAAGSRMQSIDVGLRAMDRATKAIVDLDTPGLLRDELGF